MKKLLLIIAGLLALQSCAFVQPPIDAQSELVYLGNPYEALDWMRLNTTWVYNPNTSWQRPTVTHDKHAGDCSDLSLLLASALTAAGEKDVQVVGFTKGSLNHAYVRWNGNYYEAEYGGLADMPEGAKIIYDQGFEQALNDWCR